MNSNCDDSTGGTYSTVDPSALAVYNFVHTLSAPILYWSDTSATFISHRDLFSELPLFATLPHYLNRTYDNSQSVGNNRSLSAGK